MATNRIDERNDPMAERGRQRLEGYGQGGQPAWSGRPMRGRNSGPRAGQMQSSGERLARALGWASLALGLAEVAMPKQVQRLAGIRTNRESTIRMMGLRELGHAFLILVAGRPRTGVMTRLAGDAIDLAGLGAAFSSPCHDTDRVALATAQVAGLTALDVVAAMQLARSADGNGSFRRAPRRADRARQRMDRTGRGTAFHVTRSITINRSPETLYTYWHNFENLPRFMYHLESVAITGEGRSHWVAKAPAGLTVAWDAEITDDRPNELIAWRSLPEADVPNSGVVRFEPGPAGRGTVVRVEIDYRPPAGVLGRAIAKLFGEEPGQQVAGDLRRFKQLMETGEVVRSDGSPEGLGVHRQRPAQPLPEDQAEQTASQAAASSRGQMAAAR